MTSVIVVGSGIAGLVAAIEASRRHDVLLLTKAAVQESNTRYAQGGIAAVLGGADDLGADSVELHVEDTMAAGAGLCDRSAVEVLCADGPDRVRDLIAWGVEFDRDATGLARGLEAAHSAARIVHAGGDATGAAVQRALVDELRRSPVRVLEHTVVSDLVVDAGAVTGVICRTASGTSVSYAADAVVLATGGAGQLFPYTTNPAIATGDGLGVALRAGAVVEDLEFYQFHPTLLAVPGGALISEAVRGEGAVLRDRTGRRFLVDVHPDAELAPRDVVARAIATQMAAQDGQPVLLDATGLGREFLARRFPGLDRLCRAHGLDWSERPIPITPAAHYVMGGVRTDAWGRTSLPGLFAVGEVAWTGVHGANRLASNSLLEAAVFARRCVRALDGPTFVPDQVGEPLMLQDAGGTTPVRRSTLQATMWESVGLYRSGDGLANAASALASWTPRDSHGLADLEDRNLLDVAKAVVAAALAREESRGAHYRVDHPDRSSPTGQRRSWRRKVASRW